MNKEVADRAPWLTPPHARCPRKSSEGQQGPVRQERIFRLPPARKMSFAPVPDFFFLQWLKTCIDQAFQKSGVFLAGSPKTGKLNGFHV